MLGAVDVAFDLAGYRSRLGARPMSRSFALQQIGIQAKALSDEADAIDLNTSPSQLEDIHNLSNLGQAVLNEVAADGDPLSDGTANDVERWILLSLNAQNIGATETAAQTEAAQKTYETLRDLPSTLGDWLGRSALIPLNIATNGIWAALKAFFTDPVTLGVVGGGAALYYLARKRRTA